jgi:predicted nucleic acid-binding protein
VNSYFETSAIVKLVIAEEGSQEAGAVWDASDVAITNRLAYAEARAALTAARRSRRLSSEALSDAKSALEGRFAELDLIEATDEVVRSAGDLAEDHALRWFDAIHLASALALGAEVILVTWDRDLAKAGRALGFDLAGARPA